MVTTSWNSYDFGPFSEITQEKIFSKLPEIPEGVFCVCNGHLYVYASEKILEETLGGQTPGSVERVGDIAACMKKLNRSIEEQKKTSYTHLPQATFPSSISSSTTTKTSPVKSVLQGLAEVTKDEPSSPLVYEEAVIEAAIKQAEDVTRSIDGTDGVYFLNSTDGIINQLVLKLYVEKDRAVDEFIADQLFQMLGFETPRHRIFNHDSPIGKAAYGKLKNLAPGKSFKGQKNLKAQLEDKNTITVMNYLKGKSFKELSLNEVESVFSNPDLLQKLGKMLLFDACIWNRDRLNETSSNPGNFFLTEKEGEKSIALIDHGCELRHSAIAKKVPQYLKGFFSETGKTGVEKMVKDFFIASFSEVSLKANISHAVPHILTGVRAGAERLVECFKETESIIELFSSLEEEGVKKECIVNFILIVQTLDVLLEQKQEGEN